MGYFWDVDVSSAAHFVSPTFARRCRMSARKNAFREMITMNAPTRPEQEIARLGREIYERDIRPLVEAGHHGEVVAIDVDTGNWAIGDNVIAATGRLHKKHPGAVNVLSERVGYPALRHFGGRPLRRTG